MTILVPRASTSDAEFDANRTAYEALISTLRQRRRQADCANATQHHVRPWQPKAAIVVGVRSQARPKIEQAIPLPTGQAGGGRMP